MTDNERAELCKQLITTRAQPHEQQAMGETVLPVDMRLHSLCNSIRALLAKIESIGEP